ncbi:GNAT family N-acetyltransferase [Clostridium rectalis]|uniref:GNAT family N-acetyltransferase n=1 Tax=Clostridium rectalis TaxID=2040295 RepID=UPI000F6387AA|nr:GNAT family N-acetyltransferase [Clostridium rectalis]
MQNIELSLFCQLEGARVLLRTPTMNDISAIIKYYKKNETYLAPFEPVKCDDFYTEDFWEKKIKNMIKEIHNKTSLRLFIYENNHPDIVIGTISFKDFSPFPSYTCNLRYSIAKTKQGNGYMTESLKLAIKYVFEELHIHKIIAKYMPINDKSNNLLKGLGFYVEGYFRECVLINNHWEDHIVASLINKDWKEP